MLQEWVPKTAHFDDIAAQRAFATERKYSLVFASSNLTNAARPWRVVELIGGDYYARSSLAPGASMRMSTGMVALVCSNLRVV